MKGKEKIYSDLKVLKDVTRKQGDILIVTRSGRFPEFQRDRREIAEKKKHTGITPPARVQIYKATGKYLHIKVFSES